MIELNLLPRDYRKVQKEKKKGVKIRLPKIATTPLIIGTISILLVSQAGIGILAAVQRKYLTKIRIKFGTVASEEVIAKKLEKELDELNKRFSVIESLTSGSLVWSKKLYDLSQAMIDGVWITSLHLKTEAARTQRLTERRDFSRTAMQTINRQALVLNGSAVSTTPGEETAIVGKFIESLKNNEDFFKDFEDIKLSSIQTRKVGEIEIKTFTLICYFKSGRSYFEKLAAGNP